MKYKNLPVSFRGNYKMWNELNDNRQIDEPFESSMMQSSKCF